MAGLLCVAGEPGGANLIAAFLAAGGAAGDATVWTTAVARAAFDGRGVPVARLMKDADSAAALVATGDWSVCLTGTGFEMLEPRLWAACRQRAIPTLAWLDQWSNEQRRFAAGRPDAVVAIDDEQRRRLIELGWADGSVLVGGHPGLAERLASPAFSARPDGAPVSVLVVGEPIAADVRSGRLPDRGFDEASLIAAVARAVGDGPVRVVVKPHPTQSAADYRPILDCGRPSSWHLADPRDDAMDWLKQADLVLGVGSILLLEAILLGVPVVSWDPWRIDGEGTNRALGQLDGIHTVEDSFVRQAAHCCTDRQARRYLAEQQRASLKRRLNTQNNAAISWIEQKID